MPRSPLFLPAGRVRLPGRERLPRPHGESGAGRGKLRHARRVLGRGQHPSGLTCHPLSSQGPRGLPGERGRPGPSGAAVSAVSPAALVAPGGGRGDLSPPVETPRDRCHTLPAGRSWQRRPPRPGRTPRKSRGGWHIPGPCVTPLRGQRGPPGPPRARGDPHAPVAPRVPSAQQEPPASPVPPAPR